MDEVHEFLKRWGLWKDCGSNELLENERKAVIYSMSHFVDLGLNGLALRIGDTIQAIAVYEKMNTNSVVVHFEKGNPKYSGVYQTINKLFVENEISPKYNFINREQDLGISGIRKAKQSYSPVQLIKKFNITI